MRESFFISFFSLVRLSSGIEDKFLRIKLIKHINRFFDCFLKIEKQEGESVAQCSRDNLLKVIDEIIELVEMLTYLKVLNLSPALSVQKHLLSFKSEILDFKAASVKQPQNSKRKEALLKMSDKKKSIGQKILALVRSRGEASTGEIALAFAGQVPKRTIQRHLARLVETNELQKKGKFNTLKYFSP